MRESIKMTLTMIVSAAIIVCVSQTMNELMLMQDQYLEFLNQSKLHQSLPFIAISLTSCLLLVVFTDISASGIICMCFNPLSFFVYWLFVAAPFVTVPLLLTLASLHSLINCIIKLKKRIKERNQ